MFIALLNKIKFVNPTFIFYSVFYYLLLFLLGFGVAVTFLPEKLKRYSFHYAPFIGYSYVAIIGWFLYRFNAPGTDSYYCAVIFSAALFLIAALCMQTRLFGLNQQVFAWKSYLFAMSISLVVFILLSIPMLKIPYLTSFTVLNCDHAMYSFYSYYLKTLSRMDIVAIPWFTFGDFLDIGVFAPVVNTAFFASVFKLDPFQLQDISLYLFFVLTLPVLYLVAREIFHYTRFFSILLSVLYGINSTMFYLVYSGFFSQIIAMGLFMVFFYFHWNVKEERSFRACLPYVPVMVLLHAAFMLSYPHMFAFSYALVGLIMLGITFVERSWDVFKRWVGFVLCVMGIICVLMPERLLSVPQYVMFMRDNVVMGPFRFLYPDSIVSFDMNGKSFFPQYIGILSVVAAVGIMFFGLKRTYQQERQLAVASFVIVVSIGLGALFLAWEQASLLVGPSGIYKHVKFVTFFFPILFLSVFLWFRGSLFRKKYWFKVLFVSALVVWSFCYTMFFIVKPTLHIRRIVSPEFMDLVRVDREKSIQSINIVSPVFDQWEIMWAEYFLKHKKRYCLWETYFSPSPALLGEWSLFINGMHPVNVQENNRRYPVNKRFTLFRSVAQ